MGTLVVVFAGEYDVACKEQLRAEFDRVVPSQNLVLDFSEVTYMDSTAVTELIRLHWLRADKLFERETIVVKHRALRKLFELLSLNQVFRFAGSLGEAVGTGVEVTVQYAFSGGSGAVP